METSTTTTVNLLDKEYRVSCPANEETALQHAAKHLNEKMRHIRANGVIGTERIAVMAALNITYELLQSQDKSLIESSGAQEQIKQMLGKLDQALTTIDS